MSAFDLINESKITTKGFIENPYISTSEVFLSGVSAAVRNRNSISRELGISFERDERFKRYRNRTGRGLLDDVISALSPEEKRKFLQEASETRTGVTDPNEEMIDFYILRLRQGAPDKFKDIHTSSEMLEIAKRKAIEAQTKFEKNLTGATPFASVVGGLGGELVASLLDPLNVATLPFGATISSGIVKTALIEGGINVGVEVATHPVISAWQKELGQEYGIKDLAQNTGLSFVFGAAFGGSIKAITKLIPKNDSKALSKGLLDLSIRARQTNNPELADALALEARRVYVGESKPDSVNVETHLRMADEAERAFREGRPANLEQFGFKNDTLSKVSEVNKKLRDTYVKPAEKSPIDVERVTSTKKPTVGDLFTSEIEEVDLDNVTKVAKDYETPERIQSEDVEYNRVKEKRTAAGKETPIVDEDLETELGKSRLTFDELDEVLAKDANELNVMSVCIKGGGD